MLGLASEDVEAASSSPACHSEAHDDVWYFIPSATDCPLKRVISAALAHAKAPPSLTAPDK